MGGGGGGGTWFTGTDMVSVMFMLMVTVVGGGGGAAAAAAAAVAACMPIMLGIMEPGTMEEGETAVGVAVLVRPSGGESGGSSVGHWYRSRTWWQISSSRDSVA